MLKTNLPHVHLQLQQLLPKRRVQSTVPFVTVDLSLWSDYLCERTLGPCFCLLENAQNSVFFLVSAAEVWIFMCVCVLFTAWRSHVWAFKPSLRCFFLLCILSFFKPLGRVIIASTGVHSVCFVVTACLSIQLFFQANMSPFLDYASKTIALQWVMVRSSSKDSSEQTFMDSPAPLYIRLLFARLD